ncbi:MAG: bifunctional diaminohydroxyphosphoribosylaminopyrimidine deaminase/5-amino-6-(5-phosphoribosylamino)uracil reductase RibD [Alphaproteobacteria bacterium]
MNKNMHEKFMQIAIQLAKNAKGQTGNNPSVGSVIVRDGKILATAHTGFGGTPHAETIALNRATSNTGATLYSTLEPCSHYGKTPPCVKAIIEAGIKEVVIGVDDKNPLVSGVKELEKAGVKVTSGVLKNQAEELHNDFFKFIETGLPFVTVKVAVSLDGKIATKNGDSKWISGELARNYAHKLRSQNNAILIGGETYRKDNPELTCRLEGLEQFSPKKFVISKSLKQAREGFTILDGKKPLKELLKSINHLRLLVEGGGGLITSLLKENLIDELILIRANKIMGNDGLSFVGDLDFKKIEQTFNFTKKTHFILQEDVVEVFNQK